MSAKWIKCRYLLASLFVLLTGVVPTGAAYVDDSNVTLCILMERGTSGLMYDYNKVEAAVHMALEYVNEVVMDEYHKIKMIYRNIGSECQSPGLTFAAQNVLSLWEDGIMCDAYLGMGCGSAAEPVYDLALTWNLPVIGVPSASVGLLKDTSYYDHLSRLSFTFTTMKDVLVRFFTAFNYTTPVFFQDTDNNFYDEAGRLIQSALQQNNVDLFQSSKFNQFKSLSSTDEEIKRELIKSGLSSRVFFLLADARMVRRMMLIAYDLGMINGEYLFVAVDLYASRLWGEFTWKGNDTRNRVITRESQAVRKRFELGGGSNSDVKPERKHAREAYRALMLLSLELNSKIENDYLLTFYQKVIEVSRTKYNYVFSKFDTENIDPVVIHFYESILFYGVNVQKMVNVGRNYSAGDNFTDFVACKPFDSPLTGQVFLDDNSERQSAYVMKIFDPPSGKHAPMLSFPIRVKDVKELGQIRFINQDGLPPNEPRCGYRNDNPVCTAERNVITPGTTESAIAVPIILVALISGLVTYFVRRAMMDQSDPFWWRILLQDVEIRADPTKSMRSSGKISMGSTTKEKLMEETEIEEHLTTRQAVYAGTSVTLTELPEPKRRVPNALPREAAQARLLIHPNVQKFIGVAVNEENLCDCIVGEVCQKGTLKDLIDDQNLQLDWEFKNSLIKDLASGIAYVHTTAIVSHGFLSDLSCQIDSRFVLKVCGYGFEALRNDSDLQALSNGPEDRDYRILLWRAPELLRRMMPANGTQAGDIYSFAILLQQIVLRSAPYHMGQDSSKKAKKSGEQLTDRDILQDVKRGLIPPVRPAVPVSACPLPLHELMGSCWEEDPHERPPFVKIRLTVQKVIGRSGENIVDHLIKRMETYSAGLEHRAEQQTKQFMEERARSSALLSVLLPKVVAEALSKGVTVKPETYESTTVYFGDVAGFMEAIEECRTPADTVGLMNTLYGVCDAIVMAYDVFKVETVNDAYLVVSGLPHRNGMKHVEQIASMSLALRKDVGNMRTSSEKARGFRLRVGMHSGPCVAGVVGLKMPRYCLVCVTAVTKSLATRHRQPRKRSGLVTLSTQLVEWNLTENVSYDYKLRRSTVDAGKIHVSEASKSLLDHFDDFILSERGMIDVKGKTPMTTYWLMGRG